MARDPICGKTIDELRARAVGIYGGRTFYFCSLEHKAEFAADPSKWDGAVAEPTPLSSSGKVRSDGPSAGSGKVRTELPAAITSGKLRGDATGASGKARTEAPAATSPRQPAPSTSARVEASPATTASAPPGDLADDTPATEIDDNVAAPSPATRTLTRIVYVALALVMFAIAAALVLRRR